MGIFGDDNATVPLDALGMRYIDPFETAAARTRESVTPAVGRPEGRTTKIGEAIAERVMGLPIGLAGSVVSGVTLPGEVYAGRASPYDIGRGLDLAGLVVGGGASGRVPARRSLMESKSAGMYNPPVKPPRAFSEDYPNGAPSDSAGYLTHDIEGRPLGEARWVVGRRVVGGEDQAFPTAELDALTKATTGRGVEAAPPRQMGQIAGRTLVDRYTGRPRQVYVRNDLRPDQAAMVLAHENGHVISQLAGEIPTAGLGAELRPLYDTLNNPNRSRDGLEAASWGKPFRPEALGYRASEVPQEYMAEPIRAYLADPNYLKTVAPKTATRIRAYVYAHPEIANIIRFNAIALPAAVGAYASEER